MPIDIDRIIAAITELKRAVAGDSASGRAPTPALARNEPRPVSCVGSGARFRATEEKPAPTWLAATLYLSTMP